ncbi:MAG: phosphoenolpyruvate synthase [Cyclobacteriaceae bacterium]
MKRYTIPFNALTMKDVGQVGGKNASLGEMIGNLSKLGVRVPDGFALTAEAFYDFLTFNSICPRLQMTLDRLERTTLENLSEVGAACRDMMMRAILPESVKGAILTSYADLEKKKGSLPSVAVRSSATAEDSPSASFAGQHDSFLNVRGGDHVLDAVKRSYASLFNDRAIKYRIDNGFSDMQVGQSVGIQLMVRSDKSSAGVAFTLEPEHGNENIIYITGSWGLGESVVQGAVNTDEFYLFKPSLERKQNPIVSRVMGDKQQMLVYSDSAEKDTSWRQTPQALRDQYVLDDDEVATLGRWCLAIEKHYKLPMDIEWAKDGETGELFIVQARPETVHARHKRLVIKEYDLHTSQEPLLTGKAVGGGVVSGRVSIVKSLAEGQKVQPGDIIVADITNPDWNALLRRAICIVTNKGGRTSHASIVARELGIPAVVGTMNATERLTDGQSITVSCASGDAGLVYDGKLTWEEKEVALENIGHTTTKPMFILADPQKALLYASYPNEGVGLMRMEFTISNSLQVHPMALVKFDELQPGPEKKQIQALTRHYADKKQFFIEKLAESIALVAAAFYPKDVIVRMSDFKTNEYAKLLGGKMYEPEEENPMLGFRGASRYYHPRYREGFGLECMAVGKVRKEMGLTNVKVMIPFCRTIAEAVKVQEVMKTYGLERGKDDLEIYVMAEIPSNILMAEKFAMLFDGFSIGSNDLTQLTLGLDRDSAIVSDLFDENDDSVKMQIRHVIEEAHKAGVEVGLCGQAPSDYPEFAKFLVECGIDSISFNPDAFIRGITNIVEAEGDLKEIVEAH